MEKYFIDNTGKYLGAFIGSIPTGPSIEVNIPPSDGRLRWDGLAWVEPDALKDTFYEEKLEAAYVAAGVTDRARLDALWEKVMEAKPEAADALQVKIDDVKVQNPKP